MRVSDQLREALKVHTRSELKRPKRAAVLVGLIEDESAPRLLLTRRADTLGTHGGEVAFPGGMMDPTDLGSDHAALREAHEEVSLPPSAVELLGPLDDMMPKSRHVAVTPWVGVIRDLPPLKANPSEVAHIFEIPLNDLYQRERWRVDPVMWGGREWPLFSFEYQGERLWGLSAYITLITLSFTHRGAPLDLKWRELNAQQLAFERAQQPLKEGGAS